MCAYLAPQSLSLSHFFSLSNRWEFEIGESPLVKSKVLRTGQWTVWGQVIDAQSVLPRRSVAVLRTWPSHGALPLLSHPSSYAFRCSPTPSVWLGLRACPRNHSSHQRRGVLLSTLAPVTWRWCGGGVYDRTLLQPRPTGGCKQRDLAAPRAPRIKQGGEAIWLL